MIIVGICDDEKSVFNSALALSDYIADKRTYAIVRVNAAVVLGAVTVRTKH